MYGAQRTQYVWGILYTFLSFILPNSFNPLNAELNPICHLLALVGAHHILHVSRIRVNAVMVWLS